MTEVFLILFFRKRIVCHLVTKIHQVKEFLYVCFMYELTNLFLACFVRLTVNNINFRATNKCAEHFTEAEHIAFLIIFARDECTHVESKNVHLWQLLIRVRFSYLMRSFYRIFAPFVLSPLFFDVIPRVYLLFRESLCSFEKVERSARHVEHLWIAFLELGDNNTSSICKNTLVCFINNDKIPIVVEYGFAKWVINSTTYFL